MAIANLRLVFIAGHIAYPMCLVLDGLLPLHQFQYARQYAPLGRKPGDLIDHFRPFLPCLFDGDLVLQLGKPGLTLATSYYV
jgi:hypothetical protein